MRRKVKSDPAVGLDLPADPKTHRVYGVRTARGSQLVAEWRLCIPKRVRLTPQEGSTVLSQVAGAVLADVARRVT